MTAAEFFLLLSAIYAAPRMSPTFGNAASLLSVVAALVAIVLQVMLP